MKFSDLLKKYTDKDIIERVINLYPDEKGNLEGYVRALDELRNTKPIKTTSKITLTEVKDDEYGEPNYMAVGTLDKNGEQYSASFIKWGKWLEMEFVPHPYPELSALALCLWEITWYGFSDKSTQKELNKLSRIVEKAKKEKGV